jgi:hypothetical protein
MGAPVEICSKRGLVAVVASGLVISLTALTGGLAPAVADPEADPIAPTTSVPAPEPEVPTPEETTVAEDPSDAAPSSVPVTLPAPPTVESPSQTQAPEPPPTVESPPQTQAPEPHPVESPPQTQAPEPHPTVESPPETQAPGSPTTAANPPLTTAEPAAPRDAAASTTEPAPVTSTAQFPASLAPGTTSAPVTTSTSPTTSVASIPPSADLVAPNSETSQAPAASSIPATPTSGPAAPETDPEASDSRGASRVAPSPSSTLSQAAKVIETLEPQTLQAPEQDVQLAKSAKPLEQKTIPAPEQDIDALVKVIDLPNRNRDGRDEDSSRANAGFFRDGDRGWDRTVRQWRRDWVEYDRYYRPIILNPYRDPVRIVYIYQYAPRIVVIPPLARIVLEAAEFAAYSFTAVVLNPVNTAANVAVGSFFGGGYFPGIGLPIPPPPPPVLRYDNVPVLVRYSQAVYEPFRVRRIIDVGDDIRFGERKVLLDGATPAWGTWTQTPTGERQFEVHRTQQFPGLDDPQEAPLPGDYPLRLASDDLSSGNDRRDIYLIAAAGVIAALGLGAIVFAILLWRRQPQH